MYTYRRSPPLAASCQELNLEKNGPSPWEIRTFGGHVEANISNGSGYSAEGGAVDRGCSGLG